MNELCCACASIDAIAARLIRKIAEYRDYYGPIPTKQSHREETAILDGGFAYAAARHFGLSRTDFNAAVAAAANAADLHMIGNVEAGDLHEEEDAYPDRPLRHSHVGRDLRGDC